MTQKFLPVLLAVCICRLAESPADAASEIDSWVQRNSGTTARLRAISYGKGQIVVVGDAGTVLVSRDTMTWTQSQKLDSDLWDVVYAKEMFVALGSTGAIYTSPNGVAWTKRRTGSGSGFYLDTISFGNGRFVTAGLDNSSIRNGTKLIVLSSEDGMKWDARPNVSLSLKGIEFADGRFFAGSRGFDSNHSHPTGPGS